MSSVHWKRSLDWSVIGNRSPDNQEEHTPLILIVKRSTWGNSSSAFAAFSGPAAGIDSVVGVPCVRAASSPNSPAPAKPTPDSGIFWDRDTVGPKFKLTHCPTPVCPDKF